MTVSPLEKMVEFGFAVLQRAAANTGDTLFATSRRPKSQAYLLGRLSKEFPEHAADHRTAVATLQERIKADPATRFTRERRERPPKAGCEPVISTVWIPRIEQLATALDLPRTSRELCDVSVREFGWNDNFYAGVVTAGEFHGLLEYEEPFWMKAPKGQRRMPVTQRVLRRPVQCELEVLVTEPIRRELLEEQGALWAKKSELDAEDEKTFRDWKAAELDFAKAIEEGAQLAEEMSRAKLEHRRRRAEVRAAIERILSKLQAIGMALVSGRALRLVDCEERWDYERCVTYVVRLDTRDIVERRPMSEFERMHPGVFSAESAEPLVTMDEESGEGDEEELDGEEDLEDEDDVDNTDPIEPEVASEAEEVVEAEPEQLPEPEPKAPAEPEAEPEPKTVFTNPEPPKLGNPVLPPHAVGVPKLSDEPVPEPEPASVAKPGGPHGSLRRQGEPTTPGELGLSASSIGRLAGCPKTTVFRYFKAEPILAGTFRAIEEVLAKHPDEIKKENSPPPRKRDGLRRSASEKIAALEKQLEELKASLK
jgi:hypothetical protein